MNMKIFQSNRKLFGTIIILIALLSITTWSLVNRDSTQDNLDASSSLNGSTSKDFTPGPSTTSNASNQSDLLKYLIEEEKLAHDVYAKMYDLYGSQVFGNILRSEQNHQSQVKVVMEKLHIADPRPATEGKFTNQKLQALYDQLVTQGSQSVTEAYRVGIAIEEKDIADITKQLATATDPDVTSTLERLRNGSENHLRAFNRQLAR